MLETLTALYGEREAAAMVREIFFFLKDWSQTDYTIHLAEDYPLSDYIKGKISEILARLKRYEPLQYITGQAHFYGLDVAVEPGVLIPRSETAELVDAVVSEFRDRNDLRVVDVCCGSGCIAVALSRYLPFSHVTAMDVSDVAVKVARDNVRALRCNVSVEQQDVFTWQPREGMYDIVVSNPPYICDSERALMSANVLKYEPSLALFVPDTDALRFYRAIARVSLRALVPGGWLFFEINPLHKDELVEMLNGMGYVEVTAWRDSSGKYRFVKCQVNYDD